MATSHWLQQITWFLVIVYLCASINAVASKALKNDHDGGAGTRRNSTTSEILRIHLKQALSKCNSREPPPLQRVLLNDQNAVCNDGSPAGYFIRKSYGSHRWIVFLEGGWFCFDKRSCDFRWSRFKRLMTSSMWPESRQGHGVISPDPEENPYWWNANHVFVPYCSSDAWSGAAPAGNNSRFAFMGSVILKQVLRDLLPQGLRNASKLFLTGSSSGGIGVLLNLDRVSDFLRSQGSRVEVRGVADSGWFLDNVPYAPADCYDPMRCAPVTAVQLGHQLWSGQVPASCKAQFESQPWKCYFGYRLHRTLKSPLFVFQWVFDEAQMTADNVGLPMSKDQWDYIHALGDDLRATLTNLTAVFAPSCISHSVLSKRDWQSIQVNGITLPQALRCWELQSSSSMASSRLVASNNSTAAETPQSRSGSHHSLRHGRKKLQAGHTEASAVLLADDPELFRKRKESRRRKEKRKQRKVAKAERKKGGNKEINTNRRGQKQKKDKREKRTLSKSAAVPEFCHVRLVDRCSWPQCNRGCPKLQNPFTGEDMDFIQLLKSFGLDMRSVANALGIDLHTLNGMEHDTLLQLLTQKTN